MMPTKSLSFSFQGSDPDVCIRILGQAFILHSHILKLCSSWFATSMSQQMENSTSCYKYFYVLHCDEDGVSTLLSTRDIDAIGVSFIQINLLS